MIRQFQSHKFHRPLIQSWNFYHLNDFLLDGFTRALYRGSTNKYGMEPEPPLNRTPFIFAINLKDVSPKKYEHSQDPELTKILDTEVNKINHTLSIYTKPYSWYTYINLHTDGNFLIFRNWINGQDKSKINALTIIEKVNLLPEDESYYRQINEPHWYPSLASYESYKIKDKLTQTISNKKIIIE